MNTRLHNSYLETPTGIPGAVRQAHQGCTHTCSLPATLTRDPARQVTGSLYSLVNPTPTLSKPQTVVVSHDMAAILGLDPDEGERTEFSDVFSGNGALPSIDGCGLPGFTTSHCPSACVHS